MGAMFLTGAVIALPMSTSPRSTYSACLVHTIAVARTGATGSLAVGYGTSFLVGTGILLIAMVLVATQLNQQAGQSELARQRQEADQTRADTPLPQN